MPVRVVPTFAPSVSGNISSRVMRPTAAIGVSVDVVIDDDCTRIVMPQPMTMLRKGWYPTAFLSMRAAGPLKTIWR
eukprot:29053-Pelagococcus_subviridis.AAC.1